jgi:hypothetical protein
MFEDSLKCTQPHFFATKGNYLNLHLKSGMDFMPISRYDMCKIPLIGYDGTKMGIKN